MGKYANCVLYNRTCAVLMNFFTTINWTWTSIIILYNKKNCSIKMHEIVFFLNKNVVAWGKGVVD